MFIVKGQDGLRYMFTISSNAYEDREKEIVSNKALEDYVKNFIPQPALFWHGGDPIGEIIEATKNGAFLIEIIKELPDREINLAKEGEPPLMTTIKDCWDRIQQYKGEWGASIGFKYIEGDDKDGVFDTILKVETSILPLEVAANPFTYTSVIRS